MLVQAIGTNLYKNNQVNFGAKKTAASEPFSKERCANDIQSALSALGDKKLEVIIHNASAPSLDGKDVGVGSLYSNSSRKLLIPFLNQYGISGIQVDPEGMRPVHDASPYVSNSFVYNPLIIDLEDLTKPGNGTLVDKNVFASIVKLNPAKGSKYGDFEHAKDSFGLGLANAWDNFKDKSEDIDSISNPKEKAAIEKLSNQFDNYLEENGEMLEPYAIYSILTEKFNNDYYENWPQEYKNLYNPVNEDLINEIKEDYQDDIDKFIFVDMLAKNARDKGISAFEKAGIKTEGDNPVAFSNQEVWAHKSAFLPDFKMGCPPDGSSGEGQAWGFAVLNPEKLFNEDGSLGEAGELLYDKCKKLAKDNKGGIRIDHIVGLIDPFVYKNRPADDKDSGRLFSSEDVPSLAKYAISRKDPDMVEKFGRILSDIVLPACEEAGITKDDIICEDLGQKPDWAKKVMQNLGLGGIFVTQYEHNGYRVNNTNKQDTVMLGSHDSQPFATYVDELYGPHGQDKFNHALWIAVENSLPKKASHNEKQAEFDKFRFDTNRHQPDVNKNAFVEKKYAELFTSPAKRVQFFWVDLLGSKDRYNLPGTASGNWSLRMSSDFEKNFDPTTLIKSLEIALKAQDDKFVKEHQDLIQNLEEDSVEMPKQVGSRLNIEG